MTGQQATIQILTDYFAAFSTLDVDAFLPYFHEPSLLIGPQGVFAAPTRAVIASAFAPTLESLRTRGFARSELRIQHASTLSESAALVTGMAIRYKTDGLELERVGTTYMLHKKGTDWKIAVVILHDADEDKALG